MDLHVVGIDKSDHPEIYLLPSADELPLVPPNERPSVMANMTKRIEYPEDMKPKEVVQIVQDFVKERNENDKVLEAEGKKPDIVVKKIGMIKISYSDEKKEYVDVNLLVDNNPDKKFQYIRRITGYLVGTVDRWNDGKTAELHDRVKHLDMGDKKVEIIHDDLKNYEIKDNNSEDKKAELNGNSPDIQEGSDEQSQPDLGDK